jgi:GMP synthase-like glutamine amidotransferase
MLLVIDPSTSFPESAGLARIAQAWCGELAVLQPALQGDGPTAATPYDAEAVVVMGSRASVHDDHGWLSGLRTWLRPIVQGSVPLPLLGICFGHQLIGHLAGAEVGLVHDGRKLLGVADSELHSSRLLSGRLRVVVSHAEEVKTLPGGFVKTAERQPVRFDGLEHGSLPIFSFQFHPEAGAAFLSARGCQVGQNDADALERDSVRLLQAFARVARLGRQPAP